MKRKALSLLLTLGCLCSCQSGEDPFPFVDDSTNTYMTRSGDNYGKSGLNHPYESMCRPFSRQRMEEGLSNGRPTLLFLYSNSCKHCEEAHNDLTRFFLSSGVEVEGLCFPAGDYREIYDELFAFLNAHPGISNVLSPVVETPSMVLIKNEKKALNLQFLSQRESLQNLYDFFKGFMNFTYVYTFHTYDAFARFYQENDCLIYVDEKDDEAPTSFYEDVYPLAMHSQKKTAHIETAYVSKEDQAKFDLLLPDSLCQSKKGELSPIPYSSISTYYA